MQGQRGHPGEGSSRPGDLRPHLGKAVRGGRDSKISSKASSIPTRPSLKPSSYKENESARLPVQQSSSRDPRGREPVQQSSSRDPRGGETNTNFVVGSYRSEVGGGPSGLSKTMSQQPWGTGQPAALSDSPSRSSRKEKERDRSSMQQSSSRPDPRSRGTDEDYGVGGLGSVSQGRSGYKEKESVRPLVQQNSSRQDPRAWGRDDDYVTRGQGLVGSYRGEAGGGTSGQPQPWTGNPAFAAQKPSGRQPEYTSGGSSRISYTERDHHASNIPMETMSATAHSPRYPPYTRATMPQRREEERPWYNTPVSGSHVVSGTSTVLAITAGALLVADLWRRGRSQSEDPNQTNPDGPSSPTEGSSPPEDPRHTTNSDTRFFTTTTTHPSMRKRFTVRVSFSMIPTSR
jgi:hypothetical protein